ncbi:hypothetical protein [Streptomyces paradoxus]|uniref:hypothetical protein n=1 Tax=Streptomyces paradoxus TaxID=66375 RepID=UPI0037D3EAAE
MRRVKAGGCARLGREVREEAGDAVAPAGGGARAGTLTPLVPVRPVLAAFTTAAGSFASPGRFWTLAMPSTEE